jgi:hypothetical protein
VWYISAVNPTVSGHICALVFVFVVVAVPVWAQAPSTQGPRTEKPSTPPTIETQDGTLSGTGPQLPGILFPPRVGLDALYAPPAQGRLILTPSITISEEFNDNVFLTSVNKHSDFITQFTPGVTLAIHQPGFQLTAGYNFTAEIYARDESLDNAANRQRFVTSLSYQPNPVVTLNLTEVFSYNKDSNAASIAGISSGRQEVWSNVFAPSLDFRLTPRTIWHLFGGYTLERYGSRGSLNSDLYRVGTGVDFAVTPRFSLTGGYDFAYLDIERQAALYIHTPRVGATYRATPTVTATLSGGPSFVVSDRDTTVSPAVTARVDKVATWGAIGLFYDRTVSSAGGFGGPSENQTFGGNLTASRLWRSIVVDLSPRYTISNSESVARSRTDIKALTLTLSASYQIARNIAVVGAYTFFSQQQTGAGDVDQNRVFIGLRFGQPIPID